jgi:hypothetical protein
MCQGYARVQILVLNLYIFLHSPGSSSNYTAICQYFLCTQPFSQCFLVLPKNIFYRFTFYFPLCFLLLSFLFLSFLISSFLHNFFTFLVPFSNCFPRTALNFLFIKRGLKIFYCQNALSWILLLKDSSKRVLRLAFISQ